MPRQTMSERNADPFYFEVIQCSECCGVDGLLKHKFTDELTCANCVDKINADFNAAKKMDEERVFENEAMTLHERNA